MSTSLGQKAETVVAEYLLKKGCRIIAKNWRTRFCEVDLIAKDANGIIRFIEVKYRKSDEYGKGFEYITADKARRLRRAAAAWMSANHQVGDYRIDVASVDASLGIDYFESAVTD